MRSLFLSLLAAAAVLSLRGQCLVVNINLADCHSCYNNIIHLDDTGIRIPRYAVMEASLAADSAEVEQRYKFRKMGFKVLYNDALHRQTLGARGATTLSYFNKDGRIEWSRVLKSISARYVQDSILPLQPELFSDTYFRRAGRSYLYDFYEGMGILKIRDREEREVAAIYSSGFPYERLLARLDPAAAYILQHYGMQYNKDDLLFSPGYLSFATDTAEQLYLLFEYASIRDTAEDIGGIYKCISHYSREGRLLDIYPVKETDEYSILFEYFFISDSGSLIGITHDYRDWIEGKAKRGEKDFRYLSEYVLENGSYVFKRSLPYRLPRIYAEKYHESYLSLVNATYPYVVLPLSNEILDIRNGHTAHIINDSVYQSLVDYHAEEDYASEPVHLSNTGLDRAGNLYVPYRYTGTWYLNAYDPGLRLLYTRELESMVPGLSLQFVQFDTERGLIRLHCGQRRQVYHLPLTFFN